MTDDIHTQAVESGLQEEEAAGAEANEAAAQAEGTVRYIRAENSKLNILVDHPTLEPKLTANHLVLTLFAPTVQEVANSPEARRVVTDYCGRFGLPDGRLKDRGEGPFPLDKYLQVIEDELTEPPPFWAFSYEVWKPF